MQNILFVCSQNKLRSPTAEQVFSEYPGLEVLSAGTNNDAVTPLDAETVSWADIIFVMEKSHLNKVRTKFRSSLNGTRVICLNIPDDYEFMDPDLIRLLQAKVPRFL
ncbi:low molecular weight protein tyrosine phosphatase family protein [Rhizobium sp. KVB221]|uniref:Low molecular weight protein tyrosine phosphatase family protein n=1 Tax=Rhizobium setariae TaxID=2801340 RepID=A0A936YSB0_9HYPH|nr:low molecular weight protein tyrosine phosphatase family protein [Rhizobium setariae]MBL0373892.1 low molecular weight protein tyrosine phosphatase family protein [Rhizobium setariae]